MSISQQIPLTSLGCEKLQEELDRLKTVERPQIIKAIAEARAHGDLSENAEYHSAKERQSFIEGRIAELEDIMARVQVIDPETIQSDGKAIFGCYVEVKCAAGKTRRFQLVGAHESHLHDERVSIASPVGRALIGKRAGDIIEVSAPSGPIEYEILTVRIP